jgi:phosphatidylglycerophosphate synthase
MSAVHAVIVAPPPGARRWVITGLTLAERARRVAVRAGVLPEHVHVVATPAELETARQAVGQAPVLLLRARDQLVAAPLVEPLELDAAGTRAAVDLEGGTFAGAFRVEGGERVAQLFSALLEDLAHGDVKLFERWQDVPRVGVTRRARCRCITPEDARKATAWQFELVHKPMDAFMTRRFWRPIARPFTRIFLRLPFTPNHISIGTMILGIAGCVVAAGPTYLAHLVGMTMLFVSAIGDNLDGEVARLRLESSKLGAWLDAIGDDVARVATLLGVGLHVAWRWPGLPVTAITMGALAATLLSMGLIYWYCIFVIKSSNNQDYTKVLGVGPGVQKKQRPLIDWLGNLGAQIVRRDFIDVFVFATAIVALPELSFVGLTLGAIVGLAVILPTHLKIVKQRRLERASAV